MKKLFYILTMVITFTMFSISANARTIIYLHYNYPNCTEEEYETVNDWWVIDESCLNYQVQGEDLGMVLCKDEGEYILLDDYKFPTFNGYKFLGFFKERAKGVLGDAIIFGLWLNQFGEYKPFLSVYYYQHSMDLHLYGKWEKIEDETTTDIKSIEPKSNTMDIYALNGSKINGKPKSGIYIVNGKKVVIK